MGRNLLDIPYGYYLIIIQFFMLVNTALFFPDDVEFYRNMIIIFLLSFVLMFAMPDLRATVFSTPLRRYLPKLLLGLIVGLVVMYAGVGMIGEKAKVMGNVALPILFLDVFIVAAVEEQTFRGMLAKRFGVVLSGVAFALFHIVAYGFSVFRMIYAFVMHFILYFAQQKVSPESSSFNSGIHAAINYYNQVMS